MFFIICFYYITPQSKILPVFIPDISILVPFITSLPSLFSTFLFHQKLYPISTALTGRTTPLGKSAAVYSTISTLQRLHHSDTQRCDSFLNIFNTRRMPLSYDILLTFTTLKLISLLLRNYQFLTNQNQITLQSGQFHDFFIPSSIFQKCFCDTPETVALLNGICSCYRCYSYLF